MAKNSVNTEHKSNKEKQNQTLGLPAKNKVITPAMKRKLRRGLNTIGRVKQYILMFLAVLLVLVVIACFIYMFTLVPPAAITLAALATALSPVSLIITVTVALVVSASVDILRDTFWWFYIHARTIKSAEYVLIKDVKNSCVDRVKRWIGHGISVDACDDFGRSALMIAVLNYQGDINNETTLDEWEYPSRPGMVEMLLSEGANVSYLVGGKRQAIVDNENNSVLMYAVQADAPEMLDRISGRGNPMVNSKNNEQRTALMIAADLNCSQSVEWMFKRSDVSVKTVNDKDAKGNTAFMLAAIKGHYETLDLFLQNKKVKYDLRNNDGLNSFELALKSAPQEVIKLFIDSEKYKLTSQSLMLVKDNPDTGAKSYVQSKLLGIASPPVIISSNLWGSSVVLSKSSDSASDSANQMQQMRRCFSASSLL